MKHAVRFITAAVVFTFTAQMAWSQTNPCSSGIPPQQWEDEFQQLIKNSHVNPTGKTADVVYTIPVIVHVVHGGQAVGTYPNLSQGQVNSQIPVLNADYAGAGLNSGNYPLTAFTNWATTQGLSSASLDNLGRVKIANCNVQFCLATLDSLGNPLPEPGIDRINYITKGWTSPASFTSITTFQNYITNTIKPQSIWNTTKYLNIWITDENINAPGIGGLLGFATFPPLSTLSGMISNSVGNHNTDGVWCYAKAFGSASFFASGIYYSNGYNKGRTASHEIGHWLGLRHIWGDGNCQSDFCDDTPTAAAANSGTPVYPFHVGTCTDNGQDGEMYMNFMDYSNDNGKYMFTPDQAARMATALANSPYRKLMGTHGLCAVSPVAASSTFSMNATACVGSNVNLNNTSAGTPVPSYSWSGTSGVTFTPNTSATSPTVTFAAPGVYTITLTSSNGTTSSTSRTITVNALPNIAISIPSNTVCIGEHVSIIASGANFYSWSPGGVTSSSLSFNVNSTGVTTYTCNATATDGCKAKTTVALTVVECTGITEQSLNTNQVRVFPNPATNVITLAAEQPVSDLTVEITDITGKSVLLQPVSFTKDKTEMQLNISQLSNGIYLMKLQSKDYNKVIKLVKSN